MSSRENITSGQYSARLGDVVLTEWPKCANLSNEDDLDLVYRHWFLQIEVDGSLDTRAALSITGAMISKDISGARCILR